MSATRVVGVFVLCAAAGIAQEARMPQGWVVIPVEEYRALRAKADPPDEPPAPPPVEFTLSRAEYELRVDGDAAGGTARLIFDVFKEGWVRVPIPASLRLREARMDGRPLPVSGGGGSFEALLSRKGRSVLDLTIGLPLAADAGRESITVPASAAALTTARVTVARANVEPAATGGIVVEQEESPGHSRFLISGRANEPLVLSWRPKAEDRRPALPLRLRGRITQSVALAEETALVNAQVGLDVAQGVATEVTVELPEGFTVNEVSGPLVGDWDFKPGRLRVTFLEGVSGVTTMVLSGEARVARAGDIVVPLLRLPAAERETGGVGVEVAGAGEIRHAVPVGMTPTDGAQLGEPVAGRDAPSLRSFAFRPSPGAEPRELRVSVERFTPEEVLVANVDEALYDALLSDEGKTLVRARYAVRSSQRAFLALKLPATLWSASVARRPTKPGRGADGVLLLPLERGRSSGEPRPFLVEIVYVQTSPPWSPRGTVPLRLPAIDMPISQSGVVVRHSSRFRLTPEPGAFREEPLALPVSPAFRSEPVPEPAPAVPDATKEEALQRLVERYEVDRKPGVVGIAPVEVAFPEIGSALTLTSQLTKENEAPLITLAYRRGRDR